MENGSSAAGAASGCADVPDIGGRPETPRHGRAARVNLEAERAALAYVRDGRRDEMLKVLMAAYDGPLAAFVVRLVRDREIAKDICQRVFLDAFQGIDKFQGRGTLWSWLCGIAYHRSLDEVRQKRRVALTEQIDVLEGLLEEPDPAMDPDLPAKRRALEHCLGKLTVEMRAQVMMRCFLDMSYLDIAEVVGDAHSTIQVRISRILPRLRRCLAEKGVIR
jgi:RNA polymerase sigma-70 factor (ECF subfamily)